MLNHKVYKSQIASSVSGGLEVDIFGKKL